MGFGKAKEGVELPRDHGNDHVTYPKVYEPGQEDGADRPSLFGEQIVPSSPSTVGESNERMPLVYWLVLGMWNATKGSARVDLVRPVYPRPGQQINLLRMRGSRRNSYPSSEFMSSSRPPPMYNGRDFDEQPRGRLFGNNSGARIKLMRHVSFGWPKEKKLQSESAAATEEAEQVADEVNADPHKVDWAPALHAVQGKLKESLLPPARPWFDFGVGLNYEADFRELSVQARIKVKDLLSVKLLPAPTLKVQKRWVLPGAETVSLHLKYECPLMDVGDFYKPPNARLLLRLENSFGRKVRLSPAGVEFDEQLVPLGKGTSLRAAASLLFPRQIPVPDDQPLLDWRIHRLGLKTIW